MVRFPILHSAVSIMTPLLLAATGGLFTELSGMLNIALEGMMLWGAFSSIVFTHYSGSLLMGILLSLLSTMLLAAILGSVTLYLRSNLFITGLATNLLASGLTIVLSYRMFGNKGVVVFRGLPELPILKISPLQSIPILGDLFIGHHLFVYLSWILLLGALFLLYHTPFGVRLRSVGHNEEVLLSLGHRPTLYRMVAFLLSGFFCAFGGATLSLSLGAFVPNMTSGKGWIALVVIFLGQKRPLGLLLAAFVFGIADAFSNYAQGALAIPAEFILALPYVFTLLVMIGLSIYNKYREK
ncbi:MAG: ABC transporter permease [Spirochaetales bacterium]|nr:ABC transporter permease [Spirochaetales bacterium]